jgi:glycosyltransferase involved in cell wall biosynthesis
MLFTTSSFSAGDMRDRCGDDCYSYFFVCRAFAPLLERWGSLTEIAQPESRLEAALAAARRENIEAAHLSFLPLQTMHVAPGAINIAFPFWEFPDIPDYDVAGNPRNNWVSVSRGLSLILTACRFTRDAFVRAGVTTPIRVVTVPARQQYFDTPDWQPGQQVVIDCPAYHLRELPPAAAPPPPRGLGERARWTYKNRLRPYLPRRLDRCLAGASRAVLGRPPQPIAVETPLPFQATGPLRLEGVVYSTILNPFDLRKNWGLLTQAFLTALADNDDAMLVVKLAVSKTMTRAGLEAFFSHYQSLRLRHRCRLAVVSSFLDDQQMVELVRGSTYYLNASKAEGACLPLQDALAAGRPGIAPSHTALAEYVDDELAFVVPSRAEPTHWPWDAERRITTSWQRIDPRALAEQIRQSYQVARGDRPRYTAMAECARQRMEGLVSAHSVWPRLAEALRVIRQVPAGGPSWQPHATGRLVS